MENFASTRTAPLALAALAFGLGLVLQPAPAQACGGFFCGQQPVDQTAERILFEVGADSVTMTTQISFNGDAADFAWVLPLSEVPLEGSLSVFRQQALNALDANSGPIFQPSLDPECDPCPGCEYAPSVPQSESDKGDGAVTVYVRQEVGEYDVAVIASEDPLALVDWLRAEGYRITPAMEPYIERYTEEGLKFLALKLLVTADVQDLSPFRFSLPGTAPSIPLRMTALAAEPEMSIVAFVLADTRFEGKNWPNLEIADDQIRYNPFNFSNSTNWAPLVAQAVDEAGGQGWVTEFAGPSVGYADLVRAQVENGNFSTAEDAEAAEQLLAALSAHPYLTRLYTRLSAEEMTVDPVLGRSSAANVDRLHQLSRFVNGIDQCSEDQRVSTDPCDFTTCGAGGLCRSVLVPGEGNASSESVATAGCACLPGATARVTFAPDGSSTVICQDGRMSFLNAGDRDIETDEVLPDACAGFDCGENGRCMAVNMTPTCVCDQGFIAVGGVDANGARRLSCVEPDLAVTAAFYARSMPDLPLDLPGGRELPRDPSAAYPMPRETPVAASSAGGGGCTLSIERGQAVAPWVTALLIGLSRARRRRRP